MQLRKYILTLSVLAILSWVGFWVVINNLSPLDYLEIALLFFFLSLFVAVFLTTTLINLFIRKDVLLQNSSSILVVCVRQGLLISVLVIAVLILQLLDVLNWWIGSLLIVSIVMLEYYFASKE